jgi:hypothetical protein
VLQVLWILPQARGGLQVNQQGLGLVVNCSFRQYSPAASGSTVLQLQAVQSCVFHSSSQQPAACRLEIAGDCNKGTAYLAVDELMQSTQALPHPVKLCQVNMVCS